MTTVFVTPDAPVSTVIRRPTVTVPADATVSDAARIMQDANVSAVLVEGTGAIVTERDLAHALGWGLGSGDPITSIATREPLRVPWRMPIIDCARTMVDQRVRHLVVGYPDQPDAIVSLRDVVTSLIVASDPIVAAVALREVGVSAELWLG